MSSLPCKNPNCKSNGTPHPNCKCYGGYAKGGMVHFCSENRMHHPSCSYYAEGGIVPDASLPEDHGHAIAGHIAHSGILGILHMHKRPDIEHYDKVRARGHKIMGDEVERIFSQEKSIDEDRSLRHKKIDEWLENGGITQDLQSEIHKQNAVQSFADGGIAHAHSGGLKPHPIESAYPEQNIMLNNTKGRVSQYLNSLRPQKNAPKLAFDSAPDDKEQRRSYNEAIKIADHPLSILGKVAKGTIAPEHIQHLNAMYPEVGEAIKKKVTEYITHEQLRGKKPPSKIRQSLSLLMGAPLSGEFSPQNIQAAQSVFAAKQGQTQQPQQAQPHKSSAKSLTNSDRSFLTQGQSLVARSQRKN